MSLSQTPSQKDAPIERYDWESILKPNVIAMKILGLWPDDETWKVDFYILYTVGVQALQILHIIFSGFGVYVQGGDIDTATKAGFVMVAHVIVMFKIFYVIKNMKMLKRLLRHFDDDIFQPRSSQQTEIIHTNVTSWRYMIGTQATMAYGWCLSFCITPILDGTFRSFRLPFIYPFNTEASFTYEILYLYQFTAIGFATIAFVAINKMINILTMYIGAQYDILADNIRNLNQPNDSADNVEEKFKNIVKHHKAVLKFAYDSNQFYDTLLFFQFFVAAVTLGFALFQLTVVPPYSSEFFSYVVYINGIMMENFIFCWFGNEIEVKSINIFHAVFKFDWITLPADIKSSLVIFIERIKRPLFVSALGMFNVSLNTYLTMVKATWSYFTLLRQFQERESGR